MKENSHSLVLQSYNLEPIKMDREERERALAESAREFCEKKGNMGIGRNDGNNLKNVVIALLVPLPSLLFYLCFLSNCISGSVVWRWCYQHPLLLVNALFFLNVNFVFWLLSHVQSSHWMIDLYWTLIPVMLVHYFASHPLAQYDELRSWIVMGLTWIWSIRLSHNYLRRERWQLGAREDWRFTDMRQQYGNNWWWVSFFAVYLSQQVFLIGVCIPLYVVHSVDEALKMWDLIAIFVCASGVVIAYFSDTQLHEFVTKNRELRMSGKSMVPNLEEGLWRYSRHPNYFGEQLWWWGLVIFAWGLGVGWRWSLAGSLVNSMGLAYVTKLVEERMVKQEYRAEAYRQYQKTTSVWIPWFNKPKNM